MDEHTQVLIQVRLEKGREDLASAHLLLEHDLFRAAVNRAYYAVFHVATAALLTVDVIRSKHSGVQSAFAQYLIKPGVIEQEFYETLKFARELREESDYRDDLVTLATHETNSLLEDAGRFVNRIEAYLQEAGALEVVGDREDLQ